MTVDLYGADGAILLKAVAIADAVPAGEVAAAKVALDTEGVYYIRGGYFYVRKTNTN